MTTPPPFDPLAARCPRPQCRQMAGCPCVTRDMKPASGLHAARLRLSLAIAAHADPLLLPFFPRIGQCQICNVPGLDQQHRTVDAIAGRLEAGEYPEEVQAEYPWVPLEGVLAVQAWAAKWPGAAG